MCGEDEKSLKQTFAKVLSNREVMPGVYLMWLKSPEIALKSLPGQFLMVACGEETVLRRPISVHNVEGDKLALLFMVVGKGTEWLSHLQIGDSLDILGPLGNGFMTSAEDKNILLIAGGIGVAPLRFLMDKVKSSCKQVTLLLGAAAAEKLYPKELLPPEVNLVVATEDGSIGHKGLVTEFIPNFVIAADRVFVCGPMPMLRYMAEHQRDLKLTNKPVYFSLEMRMACGLGVCYGCTIRTKSGLKQVCKDGPVFPFNDIILDEMTRL